MKPLEFEEGDHVFLKITLVTRVGDSNLEKIHPNSLVIIISLNILVLSPTKLF